MLNYARLALTAPRRNKAQLSHPMLRGALSIWFKRAGPKCPNTLERDESALRPATGFLWPGFKDRTPCVTL